MIFSYDMVGRVDSGEQIDHAYGGEREALWGLSLMALQLWNGIRAVDFLEALPDVDANRIGCTGASGGGTQTFMLTAVDDRIKVSAPVNMISAHMQGGCLCENAPNLRLDISNIEIGALMAPKAPAACFRDGGLDEGYARSRVPSDSQHLRAFRRGGQGA